MVAGALPRSWITPVVWMRVWRRVSGYAGVRLSAAAMRKPSCHAAWSAFRCPSADNVMMTTRASVSERTFRTRPFWVSVRTDSQAVAGVMLSPLAMADSLADRLGHCRRNSRILVWVKPSPFDPALFRSWWLRAKPILTSPLASRWASEGVRSQNGVSFTGLSCIELTPEWDGFL